MNMQKDHDAFYPIIIGQKDYIGNSMFRYNFPSGSIDLKRSSIALESINMYYSWFNITNAFNNRIFTIAWPTGSVGFIYMQVIIPEGFFTLESLNSFLQNWQILNNLYLINDQGQYVYYIELVANETFYRAQLNLFEVPIALPTGWTNPSGPLFTFPTVTGRRPMVTIGSDNNFGKLIGFSPNTYTAEAQLGDLVPELSPVSSIIVQTTNLDNKYSNPGTNLKAFSVSNATFGSMLVIEPPELVFVDVTDCSISFIDIKLVDQNYNKLEFLDTAVIINLIIKIRQSK
jgi:hypothetical protein